MTKQLQQIVDRLLSEANFGVLYSACTDEMGIGRIIHDMKEEAEYRFMRGRKRPDVRPETLARWGRELSEAFALMEKNVTISAAESCTGGEMVNKAFHRRADGSTYTITAHLKKVE